VAVFPLIVDPGGWFPYLSLRWAALMAAAGFGLVTSLRSSDGPTRWPAAVAWWAVLVAVVVAASLAGPSPATALVGSLDRRFGAMTWIAHGALFVTALVAVRRRDDLRIIANGMVVGTVGVGLMTIVQQLGWDFPAHAVNRTRPGGPFGNADVLGVYCVIGVAVAVGVALDHRSRIEWRIAAMVAGALALACAAASGSRGGWIGLAVALAVLAAGTAQRLSLSRRRRAVALGGCLVVAGVVLAASGTFGRLLDLADGTARGRADTWTTAVEATIDHPVLGWGPEGLAEGLQRHVDADFERTYTRRQLPDRAHDLPLDVAGTLGIVGLMAWLGLVVAAGRGARRGVVAEGSWLSVGIGAGLIGVLVAELTLFPTFDVDAVGWLLAGALVGCGVAARGRAPSRAHERVLTGLAALVAVVGLVVAVRGVSADRQARRASDALALGHPSAALAAARSALDAEPSQTMPALVLAQAVIDSKAPTQMRRAMAELEAVRRRSVDDGRIVLVEGRVLAACGSTCAGDRPGVQRRADQLVTRDPARSDGWRLEAQLAEDRGDYADAVADRRRVVDLGPTLSRGWRELALTLRRDGQAVAATQAALRAVQLDPTNDANIAALSPR
jgi:O-antigen ligase